MFYERLRKFGEDFEVTIPDEEVHRLGLVEGQFVNVDLAVLPESSDLYRELRIASSEELERI